jgi:hypothetical protein
MPGQYSSYGGVTTDTSRYPSTNLWHQVDADMQRRGIWRDYWWDGSGMLGADVAALPTTVAAYMGGLVFTSTGGTFTHVQTAGEEGDVKVSSDGANEGANFSQGTEPFTIVKNAGELVFECRFKVSAVTNTTLNTLIGLMETHTQSATVPIPAAPTEALPISDNNFVGFNQNEVDGDQLNTIYKADGQTLVTLKADAHTLVADTYVKTGMVFNRNNDNILRWHIDGFELPDTQVIPAATAANFPDDVQLGVVFAVLNGATTTGVDHLSWIRCAQRRAWVL